MIIANQWYNIAKTSTLGSTTGIRIEFGSYYALVRTAVDYGNIVITAVESNIGEEKIKVGVRIRYNRGWFADVRISPTIDDADLKASVYENNGWTAVSPNTSTAGSTVCIINDVISQMLPSSGGESLWERVNVGTEEEPKYALVPKEYDGFKPGIVTHTFVTFGGMGSGATGEGGTGNGAVILDGLEDVQIINPTPGQVLTYDETTGLWINKSTDFVTQQYVDDAVTSLSGNITTLQGYFFNGAANNALMLGGQLPEYYATATGLTALSDRVAELEKYFYFDKERNAVCVKEDYNFIVPKYITFGGLDTGSGEGDGGLSRVTIYLGETPYTSETGVVRLPAYPVIPTDISAFNNDKAYATVTEVNNAISTAIFPLSGNINTLRDNINTLQGYFTDGSANNALMLGGQLPEYYATNSALTAVSDRVTELEKLFYYDAEHDAVRTNLSLIVDQWLTFGGAAMGSGSVTGATTLAGLNDVQIADPADGQSLVYDAAQGLWVNKAVSGGVSGDYLPITGGVVSGTIYTTATPGIILKRGEGKNPYLRFTNLEDVNYGEVGVTPDGSFAFWPAVSGAQGYGQWNTVLHSTNYSSYALPLSGGTITNNSTHNPLTISTNALHPAGYGSTELAFLWNGYQRGAVGFTETHGGFVATPDIDGLSPWYYLGVKSDGTPYYCVSEAFYPLLHTGNTTEAIVEGVTVPFAGTIYDAVPDFTNSFTTKRSFLGSVYLDGTNKWYNVISVRHRNGVSDGTGYGMYIATRLTETQGLFWNKQTSPGVWQGERTIIDSANIGSQSVNYANSAGNADTVDGYHASSLLNGAYINASITAGSSGWYRIGFIPSVGEVRGKISFNIRTGGGNYTPHTTNIEIDLSWNIDSSAIYAVGGGYFNAIRINHIDGGTSIECYFVQSVTSSMELNVPVNNYYNGILRNTSVSWASGALTKIDSTGTNKSISCGVGQYSSSYGFSGNASSASKLANVRTIFGQPFDGTNNVDGVITTMQVINSSVPVIKFSNGEHLDNWGNFCFGENSNTWSVRNSTSLTTQTYLQVVRATGNVLIGTTTDYGSKLYVKSTTASQGAIAAFDSSYSNYGYNYTNMAIMFNGAVKGSWGWNNVPYSLGTQYNAGIFLLNNTSGEGINIYDTGEILVRTSFMRTLGNFVADGNVLIGTTTDNSIKLQVSGNSASIAEMTSSHASEVGVRFKQNTTNKAWVGYYTSYGACLYNYTSGTHVGLADDGVLRFGANSNGLASFEFKKADTDLWQFSARYNSNQNGYFNIYHYNGTTWTAVLKMYKTGGVNITGNFVATGSVTFNLASDRRLKSNIKPLTYRNTMRVLHRLRPVSFEWNETAVSLDSTRQGLCDGFIADEYEGLIPNSGRDIWEKYRAIDYTRAIPYLAKGWQIHESELDKMRRKVKTMERRIKHLENLLVEHNITAA